MIGPSIDNQSIPGASEKERFAWSASSVNPSERLIYLMRDIVNGGINADETEKRDQD
jgi:hypothetical protein